MRKRWWLCHATDFQTLMYPSFFCCRILGIFPYKLNASTFEISKLHYILSTIVIAICCILYGIHIRYIISKMYVGDIAKNLHFMIIYIFYGFIVIITHILSVPRMRLLQTILEISVIISQESYQKISRLIHVKDILSIIFKFVQAYIYLSKTLELKLHYFIVLIGIITTYFALLGLQINMLYINCVCVLKACFKSINDTLMHMQKLEINDRKPCISRFIFHVQRNHFLLIELKALKKKHLMVSNAVQMLNTIFSLHLLATIIMIFSTTTFTLYLYIVRWQDGIFISLDRLFLDVLSAVVTYNILIITLFTWACETSKNQAQKIGITIHDLLNSITDKKIKYELYLFSLQILHREITFSAKSLNIDATLVAKIVGNITTYLIILTQFLDISHSCDRKIIMNITQSN